MGLESSQIANGSEAQENVSRESKPVIAALNNSALC